MQSIIQHDERLMNVAAAALRTPPPERDVFLREICGDNTELYMEALELVKEEESMGSFLLHPMIAVEQFPRPFQVGQTIAERFEIVREIGEGGMGVVYEAFDRKRGLRIAVKAAKPGFQRLLSPELEGALTVRHPNVCRVNEIHTAQTEFGEVDFLTMELIQGETLSAYLKARGKLPEAEGLQIARQLCAGVSAAHRSGVIHRDLKSANVILCRPPDGKLRVVITDFGLAGAPEQGEDFAGTPAYMAPELWRGEKTSRASDIYALGIIFFEMVADPKLEAAGSEDWVPDLDDISRPWARTIARCANPSPGARPADAADALAILDKRPPYRKFLLAVPLTAMVALLGALPFPQARLWLHDRIPLPPAVRLVVLPPMSGSDMSAVESGLLQDVSERVSRLNSGSRAISVTSPSEALSLTVKTPAQAQAMHATNVLQTFMDHDGADVIVRGWIIELKTLTHVRDFSHRYSASSLGAVPAALVGELAAGLQLPVSAEADVLSPFATVPYDQGLYILKQDGQHAQEAIPQFEKAAGLDPRSALPLAGLVEAEIRTFKSTKDSALLASAGRHLQDAENLQPDSVFVHLARGRLDEARGDYPGALEEYLRVRAIAPSNLDALLRMGDVYDKQNMPDRALAAYLSAIELDKSAYNPHEFLGVFHLRHGRYSEAAEQFRDAISLAPGLYLGYTNLAASLQELGQFDQAEQALRTSLNIHETDVALNNMGTLLATRKRDAEALGYYSRAVALKPNEYTYLLNLADSHRRLGHIELSRQEYVTGLGLARTELRATGSAYAKACVGYFAARLRERDRAEDEIQGALNLAPGNNMVILRAVFTYEALGSRDRPKALESARKASLQLLREMEREPDLAGFSIDSGFRQLMDKSIGKGDH